MSINSCDKLYDEINHIIIISRFDKVTVPPPPLPLLCKLYIPCFKKLLEEEKRRRRGLASSSPFLPPHTKAKFLLCPIKLGQMFFVYRKIFRKIHFSGIIRESPPPEKRGKNLKYLAIAIHNVRRMCVFPHRYFLQQQSYLF